MAIANALSNGVDSWRHDCGGPRAPNIVHGTRVASARSVKSSLGTTQVAIMLKFASGEAAHLGVRLQVLVSGCKT